MENFDFHDAFIEDISYDGNTLKCHISSVTPQDDYGYIIQTKAEEYNIRFCCLTRYLCSNQVKFNLEEIDIKYVKELFLCKKKLQIVDAFYATYQNRFVLECDVFPYSTNHGCSNKIYLEISDFDIFNIMRDNKKRG